MGLLVGGKVGAKDEVWRAYGDRYATIVSNVPTGDPYIDDKRFVDILGGYLVCDSVNRKFRQLLLAAPKMLAALKAVEYVWADESSNRYCPFCGHPSSIIMGKSHYENCILWDAIVSAQGGKKLTLHVDFFHRVDGIWRGSCTFDVDEFCSHGEALKKAIVDEQTVFTTSKWRGDYYAVVRNEVVGDKFVLEFFEPREFGEVEGDMGMNGSESESE